MAGDTRLLLDIRGRNTDALRAIAGTKAAMHSLTDEERRNLNVNREQGRVYRDVNRQLDRQSRGVRALTGDFVSLRNAIRTTGVRAAIPGFAALTSTLEATGGAAVALTNQVGLLGAGVAQSGSVMAGGGLQGLFVYKLAMKDVQKALTSVGTAHDTAMKKLGPAGKKLYEQLVPLRKEMLNLRQIAQAGIAPGLVRGIEAAKPVIEDVRQAVFDTAKVLGYLGERAGDALKRNKSEVHGLLEDQVVALRRGGDTVLELVEGYIHVERASSSVFRSMSADVLGWARNFNKAMVEKSANGDLAEFFGNAEDAWKRWTSTVGATGGIAFGVLKASNETSERLAKHINEAAKAAERWVKSDDGQTKIHDTMVELEPVMGEIAKIGGALVTTLGSIGAEGADSAVRILHGFRTQVLPVVKDLAIQFDKGLLQNIIDLARETTQFIKKAEPGFKILGDATSVLFKGIDFTVGRLSDFIDSMPKALQGIASLAAIGGLLVAWTKFKNLMALSLLSMRQMVGLAPKIRAAAGSGATAPGGWTQAPGGSFVNLGPTVGGGGGGGGRGGGGFGAMSSGQVSRVIASSVEGGMAQAFRHQAPGSLRIVPVNPNRGTAQSGMSGSRRQYNPAYDRRDVIQGPQPLPLSATRTHTGGRTPLTYAAINPTTGKIEFFDPAKIKTRPRLTGGSSRPFPTTGQMPRLAPMPGVSGGDPLTGRQRGGTALEYRRQGRVNRFIQNRRLPFIPGRPTTAEFGGALAGAPVGLAKATTSGITSGVRKAAPVVGSIMKPVLGFAALGGLINAATAFGTSDKVNKSFMNVARNFTSGMTLGIIESTDQAANRLATNASSALERGARVRSGIKLPKYTSSKDFQDAAFKSIREGKGPLMDKRTVKVNKEFDLSTSLGVRKFREEYLTALRDGKKITADQAKQLDKIAGDLQSRLAGKENIKTKLGIDIDPKDVLKGTGTITAAFSQMRDNTHASIGDVRKFVGRSMKLIKGSMRDDSASAKTLMSASFDEAAEAVRRSMGKSKKATRQGLREIGRLYTEQLKLYGFTTKQAKNINAGNSYIGGPEEGSAGPTGSGTTPRVRARGGTIKTIGKKGDSGRDNIPVEVIAGSGETAAIFTQHQKAIADDRLADVGGLEGLFKYERTPHSAQKFSEGGIVKLGRHIQKMSPYYQVGENTHFGAVHGHTPGSLHYVDRALDINADGAPGGEKKWLDQLAAYLKGKGWHYLWQVADHFDHLHVDDASGDGGATGGIIKAIKRIIADGEGNPAAQPFVQKALDNVRNAANERISSMSQQLGMMDIGEQNFGDTGTGTGAALMKSISKQYGWNFADWWSLDGSETSHGRNLANPTSTARLRGQFLDMNYGKYGPGSDPAQNPSMRQQIISMAKYIKERYGNPTKAWAFHQANNYYGRGGVVPADRGYFDVPVPGRDDGYPTPVPGGSTPPKKDKKDDKKKKPKKDKKLKPKYDGSYPSGVTEAISQSKNLIGKGLKKKGKPVKASKRARKMRKQAADGRLFDDPNFFDPITGESIDPQDQGMFWMAKWNVDRLPGLEQKYDIMEGEQNRTEEFLTLQLEKDDLRRWLKQEGMDDGQVQQWIADYGDSLEVVNKARFTVDGEEKRGVADAMNEAVARLGARTNIKNNWSGQYMGVKNIKTGLGVTRRRNFVKELRRIFLSNAKVIKRLRKIVSKSKAATWGWKAQVHENDQLIDDLQDHRRNSQRLPAEYRARIGNDIDDLQDLNRDLREKKPKKVLPAHAAHSQRTLERRSADNTIFSGDNTNVTHWEPQTMRGVVGVAMDSLENWKGLDAYKKGIVADYKSAYPQEKLNVQRIQDEIAALATTKVPVPEKVDDGSKEAFAALQLQATQDQLKQARAALGQYGELHDFLPMLQGRLIGAFAHGAVDVKRSGLALVHRNETIVPDMQGPFRNGRVAQALNNGTGSGKIALDVTVRTERGEVLGIVRHELRQNGQSVVSTQTGARSRVIAAAPGRRH